MHRDVELVPGLKPGQYMKIRSGSEVYSMKRGRYQTVKTQTVRLAHYLSGQMISPDLALNDRDYHNTLTEQGFDFAPLEALRETDRNAYFNEWSICVRSPKACWAGTGGYWCQTDIENVMPE